MEQDKPSTGRPITKRRNNKNPTAQLGNQRNFKRGLEITLGRGGANVNERHSCPKC